VSSLSSTQQTVVRRLPLRDDDDGDADSRTPHGGQVGLTDTIASVSCARAFNYVMFFLYCMGGRRKKQKNASQRIKMIISCVCVCGGLAARRSEKHTMQSFFNSDINNMSITVCVCGQCDFYF
jgi:hypothetical protein